MLLLACLVPAACSLSRSSEAPGKPRPTDEPAPAGPILGCLSIEAAECRFVAERILSELPEDRGAPFSILVQLYGCPNEGVCPWTLAVRDGMAMVDYTDGGIPLQFTLAGPPQAPRVGADQFNVFGGPDEPSSARVVGLGPFPYELGHCGLTWMVDFDGSFWVPVGSLDGDASAVINSERGQIALLGRNIAEFRGESGFTARLVRFPGPKHIRGCM